MKRAWLPLVIGLALGLALGFLLLPGLASAEDAEEEGGPLDGLFEEEPKKRVPLPWELPRQGEEECRPEEMAVMRELRDRSLLLDKREASLEAREEQMATVERELARELKRVEEMRAELMEVLTRAEDVHAENTASLSSMVDGMKAKDAAGMLSGMDEDVALEVLRSVKPKQAGKILAAMDPATSRRLGDRYTLVPDPRDELDADGGADVGDE